MKLRCWHPQSRLSAAAPLCIPAVKTVSPSSQSPRRAYQHRDVSVAHDRCGRALIDDAHFEGAERANST
jgi:hypothetical protein